MNAIILTEAGTGIGFGHVMRCASLYQSFHEKGINVSLVVDTDIAPVLPIKNFISLDWIRNRIELDRLLLDADIAIIDSYKANEEIYSYIKDCVEICGYIDDTNRINYPDGVVINGLISAESLDYKNNPNKEYLLGLPYALLRDEFQKIETRQINQDVRNVLICLGGVDVRGKLDQVIRAVDEYFVNVKLHVVCAEEITMLSENMEIYTNIDSFTMKDIMMRCDMAITGGGQLLSECAACGLPVGAIEIADNQKENIAAWAKAKCVIPIGKWNEDLDSNVKSACNSFNDYSKRMDYSRRMQSMIDGKGSERIAKVLMKMYYSQNIVLRDATLNDAEEIFSLSNEPLVRNNSSQTQSISWDEHIKWMTEKISNPLHEFFVIEVNGEFAGQLRIDASNDKQDPVISISLTQNLRGLNLSADIINLGVQKTVTTRRAVFRIKAVIKNTNIASVKAFEKAGFIFDHQEVVNQVPSGIYYLNVRKHHACN